MPGIRGRWKWELLFNGCGVSVLRDEKCSVDIVAQNVKVLNATNVYLRMIKMVNMMLYVFYPN